MGKGHFTVCGVVEISNKVLLVRHTYGVAKGRLLIPGGYVEENELPSHAIEREILEETGVITKAASLLSIQFKVDQWCPVFVCKHVSGTPETDHYENSEVLLLNLDDAINRDDITNMSREVLKIYREHRKTALAKREYLAKGLVETEYALYG